MNTILVDLCNDAQRKMQKTAEDYYMLCGAAEIDFDDARALMISTIIDAAIRAIALQTSIPADKFAQMMIKSVEEYRAAERQRKGMKC